MKKRHSSAALSLSRDNVTPQSRSVREGMRSASVNVGPGKSDSAMRARYRARRRRAWGGEADPVLVFEVAALFALAGFLIVGKVAHVASRRLGLEPYDVLTWLGLADDPVDELAVRRATPPRVQGQLRTGA